MPDDAYQALVNDLACALTPYHDRPADRLNAVMLVLEPFGLDRLELAESLASADTWIYVEAFDPDQVKHLLGEADIWPELIREEAQLSAAIDAASPETRRRYGLLVSENRAARDLIRPDLDLARVAQIEAMGIGDLTTL